MARQKRALVPGVVYHLCNRAVFKIPIFETLLDFETWIKTLTEALAKYPVNLYAYCLMPNHWHLLLSTRENLGISHLLQWLGSTHAIRWRHQHESVGLGAVYQSRFKAHAVEGANRFFAVAKYIERNPVRARLCPHPNNWPWSSSGQVENPHKKTVPISTWPFPPPSSWHEDIKKPTPKEMEALIRKSLKKNRPLPTPQPQKESAYRPFPSAP